jgi:predicted nucleic acid-binding protein
MRFVLDASVTITWAMRDEDHPLADLAFRELQSGSAIVPGIWWYEVRNILVLCERRDRIAAADSNRFVTSLEFLHIEVDFPGSAALVTDLSRKHKLSVYDAAYLALAMREHLPLATLDKDLANAASAEDVPLLA